MTQDRISTLVELLRTRAEQDPDRLAYAYLKDGEDVSATLTFAELDAQARRIAGALQAIGTDGDRALLLYAPGLEFVSAFFGCLYANRIAVPAYPPHPSRFAQALPRLRAIVEDARPRALLTTASMAALAETMRSAEPALAGMQVVATDAIPPEVADAWEPPRVHPDTLAFLQYTSDSTATPKGVMVSHGNLVHNVAMTTRVFRASRDAPMVSWLPVYHDMGLIGCILHPMYVGSSTYLMSPAAFLQRPLRWLNAVSRFRAHTSGGPNFAYDLCVRRTTPEQRASLDLSSWRVAFNGAEPVRAQTIEEFSRTFEPYGFRPDAAYPCYGLAEATLYVSGGAAGAGARVETFDPEALARGVASRATVTGVLGRALVSCGQSWDGHRAIIVDPERRTRRADGEIGEIWVKGPSVAQGYWNRADQTIETFGAHVAEESDGPFLRTGDLGFVDDGELFIAGRLKDLIIVDGRNHYPQDIELTVEACHPAMRPGCSAAFSVDVGGEERLVVVAEIDPAACAPGEPAQPGAEVDRLIRGARRAVATNHDLDLHALLLLRPGAIPKTTSGKIRRRACRDGFMSGTLEPLTAPPGRGTLSGERAVRG
jgi:acyl-CoA synthetase (AMP-forming)/AMP-acid ligase II